VVIRLFYDAVSFYLNNANVAYFALIPLLKRQTILRCIKIRTYKLLTKSVILYEAKALALSEDICERLRAFDRKLFWRIYGAMVNGESDTAMNRRL
jgi:hypothetical protein